MADEFQGISLVFDREDYRGFTGDANRLGGGGNIQSRMGLRANTRLTMPLLPSPLTFGGGISQVTRDDGSRTRTASLRASTVFKAVSLTNNLNLNDSLSANDGTERESQRISGNMIVAGRVGDIRLRAGLVYDLKPISEVRRLSINTTTNWRNYALDARLQKDFRSGGYDVSGGGQSKL